VSIRDWFITPADHQARRPSSRSDSWQPPGAGPADGSWQPPGVVDRYIGSPDGSSHPPGAAPATGSWPPPGAGPAGGSWQPPGAADGVSPARRDRRAAPIRTTAVLGRAGEAEPWAAALALALLRRADSRAAVVAVIGADGEDEPAAAAAGGTLAARRLAARLRAHGLAAVERGRLAWVRFGADDLLAVRRMATVAAPGVLAITAPLSGALEAALAELDLAVLVAAQPDGPLAAATIDAIGVPLVSARPLPRGPARALARAGIAAARPARDLLAGAR
jgi:hypothetical protein